MKKEEYKNQSDFYEDLTWREQDILLLLSDRLTNQEIAQKQHLAESTVKDYVSKILQKLYVKNRREAVLKAKALGLLEIEHYIPLQPKSNIPSDPTPFIGRKKEIAQLKELINTTQLVTISGPGGIGKTRLAIEVANILKNNFKDGCFLVKLAPVRSIDSIVQKIAEDLNFSISSNKEPLTQLIGFLDNKQILLIIDNFEHLLKGANIISEIVQFSKQVRIITTSREKLNLYGESVFTLGGMAFPQNMESVKALDYDAVVLFSEFSRKINPKFRPINEDFELIIEICKMVGGMPLALELAAAWVHALNLRGIANELKKGFDILSEAPNDTPERHRSIRTVFDYSWSLLESDNKEKFMLLSVFNSGCTLEAARRVSGITLHQIANLSKKSFITSEIKSGRINIHQLLLQYGREKLEKEIDLRDSAYEDHAYYYADFVKSRYHLLHGNQQIDAISEFDADIENIRTAWEYFLEKKNVQQIWKLFYGIWQVYWIHGWNYAGSALFEELAIRLEKIDSRDAIVLCETSKAIQAFFLAWLGDAEKGYQLAKSSVAILEKCDHSRPLACAYESLFMNAYFLSRTTQEHKTLEKLQRISSVIDDKHLLIIGLFSASMASLIRGDHEEATKNADKVLQLTNNTGDRILSTFSLIALGHIAFANKKYAEARNYFLKCLNISEDVNFRYAIGNSCKYLGKVNMVLGDLEDSEMYLHRSLEITKEIKFTRDLINIIYDFSKLRLAQDRTSEAVTMLTFVINHPASVQFRWLEGRIRDSAEDILAMLSKELPKNIFKAAQEKGNKLDLDLVVDTLINNRVY